MSKWWMTDSSIGHFTKLSSYGELSGCSMQCRIALLVVTMLLLLLLLLLAVMLSVEMLGDCCVKVADDRQRYRPL